MAHHDVDRPSTHPLAHLTLAVLTIVCLLGVVALLGLAAVPR